jgi:AcrR family transcriptional regulator
MKKALRREMILKAATSVFADKGYHRASVTDIIEKAGIARGTFYLYFEGKREIFAELVDVLTVRLMNCMRRVEISDESSPWQDQLRQNIIRISAILLEERELTKIMYNHAMGLDEEFDKKIREFYEVITKRTENAIILGQSMGLFRKEIDARIASYHIVGSVKEIMYHLSMEEEEVSPEKLINELFSYSVQGMVVSYPQDNKKTAKNRKKK